MAAAKQYLIFKPLPVILALGPARGGAGGFTVTVPVTTNPLRLLFLQCCIAWASPFIYVCAPEPLRTKANFLGPKIAIF
jgi:hypothetical protein